MPPPSVSQLPSSCRRPLWPNPRRIGTTASPVTPRSASKAVARSSAAAIDTKNNLAIAYYNRGIAYQNKRDHAKAIAEFNQSIRLNASDPAAYRNRGYSYAQTGEFDLAIDDYNQTIKLKPDYASIYYDRGLSNTSLTQEEHIDIVMRRPQSIPSQTLADKPLEELADRDPEEARGLWGRGRGPATTVTRRSPWSASPRIVWIGDYTDLRRSGRCSSIHRTGTVTGPSPLGDSRTVNYLRVVVTRARVRSGRQTPSTSSSTWSTGCTRVTSFSRTTTSHSVRVDTVSPAT